MVTYQVIEETLWNEEFGSYTAFGICAYEGKYETALVRISDLFFERASAENFVRLCNKNGLSIIHLPEVIDNLLASI